MCFIFWQNLFVWKFDAFVTKVLTPQGKQSSFIQNSGLNEQQAWVVTSSDNIAGISRCWQQILANWIFISRFMDEKRLTFFICSQICNETYTLHSKPSEINTVTLKLCSSFYQCLLTNYSVTHLSQINS